MIEITPLGYSTNPLLITGCPFPLEIEIVPNNTFQVEIGT